MKTHLIRFAVALAIATLLLSSAVLAGPGRGQGRPPENPGGVCAVVTQPPLPLVLRLALSALFGYGNICPPNCGL